MQQLICKLLRSGIIKKLKWRNNRSIGRDEANLSPCSLYRLFWVVFIVVALLPTVFVTYVLLNKVVTQSRYQAERNLEHSAQLQSEFLEHQLSALLASLEQLGNSPDVKLTPVSAVFGYQAGKQLKSFAQKSPLVSAIYIVDRDIWPVEVFPVSAELVSLKAITQQVDQFLHQAETTQQPAPYIFNVNAPAIVTALDVNQPVAGSGWVLVMAVPLVQRTENSVTGFKVIGALIALEPYQFLSPLFAKWQPVDGGIALFENGHLLYSRGDAPVQYDDENVISRDSVIELGTHRFTLRIHQASDTLKAVVFDGLWRIGLLVGGMILLASIIALLVTHRVGQQLDKLKQQVEAFAQGNYQHRVAGLKFREFLQVSKVLELLSKKVITDQADLESKVNDRTAALSEANKELSSTLDALQETQHRLVQSEKMASLGQLVGGVAHELNTPLGICVTAVGLVEEVNHSLDAMLSSGAFKKSELVTQLQTLKEATQLIGRNVRRSSDLVLMFKELSLESEIEGLSQFELYPFLQQLVTVWLGGVQPPDVKIKVSGDNLRIESYMGTLRKVLSALFENALEHGFTHQPNAQIDIHCGMQNEQVYITFSDNGSGVDVEPVSRIFEPFFTLNRERGSVGLGLHLIYNLVTQRLLGEIEAKNRPEGGLTVILTFPRFRA